MRARFINEAKQVGIIYHYTDYDAALDIIKEGKIRSDIHGAVGTLKDPVYEISFTRDKNFHKVRRYLTYAGNYLHCRFVINGDELSSNFRIIPYAQVPGFEKGSEHFEAEEKIVSRKPIYVSLDKYLIRLDILSQLKEPGKYDYESEWDYYGEKYKTVILLAREKNIPINLVNKIGNPIDYKEKRNIFDKIFKRK